MAGRPRRTRLIVNPVQRKLLARTLLHLFVVVVPVVAALVLPIATIVDDTSLSLAHREWAASHLRVLARALLPTLPAMVLLCLLHAVLVSHRVGGPLYRFGCVLSELGRGNLAQRVKLRRNDYLELEAELLNQTITSLALKVERIRQLHREVSGTMPALGRAIAREEMSEAAVLTGKLGTQLDLLGQRLGQFTLPDDEAQPLAEAVEQPPRPSGVLTR